MTTLADIQRRVGVNADGVWGPKTAAAIEALLPSDHRDNSRALNLIKQFEGCKLTAYPDPGTGGDPWTVGWGATGPGISKGVTWSQQQADDRLASDVQKFADWVDANMGTMTDGQRAALTSFAYNVGTGNLQSSTLRRKHLAGDYAGAQAEFARWNKAAGKVMAGLTRRRAAEAAEYGS